MIKCNETYFVLNRREIVNKNLHFTNPEKSDLVFFFISAPFSFDLLLGFLLVGQRSWASEASPQVVL